MKIYIFRHGMAMDRDEALAKKMDDSLRPLTEKGVKRSKRMAQFLTVQAGKVDAVVSSPLVRARQTAEIIAAEFSLKKIVESAALVPSAPPQALQQWMQKNMGNQTSVVLVGHEPQLTTFCSWLVAGTVIDFLDLKKSGIICLETESLAHLQERSCHIEWIVQPGLVD